MNERYPLSRVRSVSSASLLSRRALVAAIGLGAAVTLQGCGGNGAAPGPERSSSGDNGMIEDFSDRFAAFTAADEPNGDLAQVVWPDFVLAAGREVKRLYEFQVLNGDLMRYMPCFCG